MDSADASRRLLKDQAARGLGAEAAAVLMDHLPPAGWADLARRSDVEESTALLRGEMAVLRAGTAAEFAAVRQEMTSAFSAVRQEMTSEFAAVRQEMTSGFAAVRQDMTSGFAAVRQEMASESAALRKDASSDSTSLRAEMTTGFGALKKEIGALRVEMSAAMGRQSKWLATTCASLFAVAMGSMVTILLSVR